MTRPTLQLRVYQLLVISKDDLSAVAGLLVLAAVRIEREECAEICDADAVESDWPTCNWMEGAATKIRARTAEDA